jgi:hypothetical protein
MICQNNPIVLTNFDKFIAARNNVPIMSGDPAPKLPEATLSEFFESKPLNEVFRITGATFRPVPIGHPTGGIPMPSRPSATKIPPIRLWCDADQCDGFRNFDSDDELRAYADDNDRDTFVVFVCRNCRRSAKKYAISYRVSRADKELTAMKLGEDPPLSFHLPARLRKLVGTELEKFNKGLRSEAHGLGVGAFAYYRQVVENQKDRLIDEIIKVAELQNPPSELITELMQAKSENQFSSALDKIKQGIPEILKINGHNPLTLLHKALSEGLHEGTDAECLEIAHDIRVILAEFGERLHAALKDNQELKKSVSNVLNRPKKPS